MRYFAVIDTNVLVSAMLRANSNPGFVLKEVLCGDIIPLLNDEILSEYHDVLHRPKFRFDATAVQKLLDRIIARGIRVDAKPIAEVLPDPKDVVFYEVAMEGRRSENAYLVTGNLKHFPRKPFIVTPKEMVEIVAQGFSPTLQSWEDR